MRGPCSNIIKFTYRKQTNFFGYSFKSICDIIAISEALVTTIYNVHDESVVLTPATHPVCQISHF